MTLCASCRQTLTSRIRNGVYRDVSRSKQWRAYTRPAFAPKPVLDLKHIRQNPGLYEQNCLDRNYAPFAKNGWKILELHESLVRQQRRAVELRQRNNVVGQALKGGGDGRTSLLEEAKGLKKALGGYEEGEKAAQEEMERLALELPNLSSLNTPVGDQAAVLEYINGSSPPARLSPRSHVEIGKELDLLDFESSATTSGWGWYFLKNEGALLEQALIQFALSVAMDRGWTVMTPPSLVYSHIASACGFAPRDQNGETQIYSIGQDASRTGPDKPSLVLAGTAEIPLAGSCANKTLLSTELPLKVVGPSRCYRAEAGARGVDTKGLYRVHEFTKVEMFAWTLPASDGTDRFGDEDGRVEQTEQIFTEMVDIQKEILTSLGLHARVLEMPTADLGASAQRKIDMEVFFPSRTTFDHGYGEVTSASVCGDYQSRRLGTRVKDVKGGTKPGWPYTVNGTAMAIPRMLAAILENGWREKEGLVTVPECLTKWMPGGKQTIGPKTKPQR